MSNDFWIFKNYLTYDKKIESMELLFLKENTEKNPGNPLTIVISIVIILIK